MEIPYFYCITVVRKGGGVCGVYSGICHHINRIKTQAEFLELQNLVKTKVFQEFGYNDENYGAAFTAFNPT